MLRLTIATPAAHLDDTRNLAVALGWINGYTPAEWRASFSAQYQDAEGNIFHVSSFEASTDWIATATTMGLVERPPQDVGKLDPDTGEYGPPYVVNLAGAHRAQDKLVTWQPGDGDVPQAALGRIVAIVGPSGREALALMGLTVLQPE